jgi:hypothetical protein
MALSQQRFESGMTYEQWMESIAKNKERFVANYEAAQIRSEDVDAFRRQPGPLSVMVLGEDWCGDVIANLPIIAKLAQAVGPKLDLRIFKRDENLDIMDQYLYKGEFRSIPVVVVFDQDMNERGMWWERPQMARDEMDETRRRFVAQHADLPDVSKPPQEMSEETRKLLMTTFAQLRAENTARWTQAVVDDMRTAARV